MAHEVVSWMEGISEGVSASDGRVRRRTSGIIRMKFRASVGPAGVVSWLAGSNRKSQDTFDSGKYLGT